MSVPLDYELVLPNGMEVTGVGRTLDLSNVGIRFESANPIPNGLEIHLAIPWPSKLNNGVGLVLHASGRTVRTQDNTTAVAITHNEFRAALGTDTSALLVEP